MDNTIFHLYGVFVKFLDEELEDELQKVRIGHYSVLQLLEYI